MDKKKLKLSISGNTKKTIDNIEQAKSKSKNSVIISKNKSFQKKNFYKPTTSGFKINKPGSKPTFTKRPGQSFFPKKDISDFEKRKLAEQRATKRLKGDEAKEKDSKEKNNIKRRELKLTISRALSDEDGIEIRGRSLASLRRARKKKIESKLKKINNHISLLKEMSQFQKQSQLES